MMGEKSDNSSESDELVIAPGGPRPKSSVHQVRPGEVVRGDKEGKAVVIPSEEDSSETEEQKTNMAPNLVLTPGGYRHPSLVHRVEPGHALHVANGRLQLMNLATRNLTDIPEVAIRPGEVPGLGSGWIAYAYWLNTTGHPITSFRTTWQVPPAPSTQSGQTIFLFNGIDPSNPSAAILQPVLQWGVSAAGGGPYWSIASWYVTNSGPAFHTTLVPVNVGDLLTGVMTLIGQSGGMFSYNSEFQGIAGTSLPVQNISELVWCNETLEAYSVSLCSDYPNISQTALRAISIQTGDTTPELSWSAANQVTDCGQHAVVVSNSATEGEVDLYYRTAKSRFDISDELEVTDPILLGLFKHGWEDPGWGRSPIGQVIIASAIHTLADRITDAEMSKQVRAVTAKIVSNEALKMASET